jgi:nucleotide-binding universal stress UspA family protein
MPFRTIIHPTDFSVASHEAFAHALRIALAARATLYILHVASDQRADMDEFPHVRATLAQWGLLNANEPTQAIYERLGTRVAKVDVRAASPAEGFANFLKRHPADLLVAATEARQGLSRLLYGSMAEQLAREAKAPALFIPAHARGFVGSRGEVHLRHVLIPIDHEPKPAQAIGTIMELLHLLAGNAADGKFMHAGKKPPQVARHEAPGRPMPVSLREGDPVDAIVQEAADWPADLVAMPTAGARSVLDALRGSTTDRVLGRTPCPVLSVPAE